MPEQERRCIGRLVLQAPTNEDPPISVDPSPYSPSTFLSPTKCCERRLPLFETQRALHAPLLPSSTPPAVSRSPPLTTVNPLPPSLSWSRPEVGSRTNPASLMLLGALLSRFDHKHPTSARFSVPLILLFCLSSRIEHQHAFCFGDCEGVRALRGRFDF